LVVWLAGGRQQLQTLIKMCWKSGEGSGARDFFIKKLYIKKLIKLKKNKNQLFTRKKIQIFFAIFLVEKRKKIDFL
jgi:hypothetical protein